MLLLTQTIPIKEGIREDGVVQGDAWFLVEREVFGWFTMWEYAGAMVVSWSEGSWTVVEAFRVRIVDLVCRITRVWQFIMSVVAEGGFVDQILSRDLVLECVQVGKTCRTRRIGIFINSMHLPGGYVRWFAKVGTGTSKSKFCLAAPCIHWLQEIWVWFAVHIL